LSTPGGSRETETGRRRRERQRRKRGCRIKWARNPREDKRDAPYRSNPRQLARFIRTRKRQVRQVTTRARVHDDNNDGVPRSKKREGEIYLDEDERSSRAFSQRRESGSRSGIKAAGVPLFRETPMKTSTAAGDLRGLRRRRRAELTPLFHATMTRNETLRQRPHGVRARVRAGEKKEKERSLSPKLPSRSHVSIVTFSLSAAKMAATQREFSGENFPMRKASREPARIIPCN